MPMGKIVDFAIWLAFALAAGVLIVVVWQWLRARYGADDAPASPEPTGSGDA
jgi:hypothetical protein